MGYQLFLYDNNGKEIDFLAIKGGKEYLIAYSVAENKAYEREIAAFASLDNSRAKVLIQMMKQTFLLAQLSISS